MDDQAPESWIQRHRKWLIPAGCLGLTVVVTGFFIIIFFMVMGGMKSSDIYQEALANLKTNPTAVAALGEPIEAGLWVTGSINVTGPKGDADLAIPVSGPSGSAKLYVIGKKRAGEWSMELLQLKFEEHHQTIDLLQAPSSY